MKRVFRFFVASVVLFWLTSETKGVNPACECVRFESSRSRGSFQSPNYPRFYPTNINCILYTFAGRDSERVELSFQAFDIQISQNNKCADFLKFYLDLERPEVNEQQAWNHEMCGSLSVDKKSYLSVTGNLILELHTDDIQSNNTGFKGTYDFQQKQNFKTEGAVKRRHDTSCAYDITGIGTVHAFHILATPPMSIPYHHHRQLHVYHYQQQLQQQHSNHLHLQFINSTTSCQYYFHALPHERVKLTFLQMQLETRNQNCYDEGSEYIQVHDGLNETSVLLAEYCQTDEGLENHPQVLSSGQHLRMSYVASGRAIDRHPQRVVFEAMATFVSIKRDCDRKFTSSVAKSGTFGSPTLTNPLHGDVTCRYLFEGEEHERVQIIFNDIQLSHGSSSALAPDAAPGRISHLHSALPQNVSCDDEDSVTVTVYLAGHPMEIGVYCEDKRPPMLMSIDNHLDVTFIKRSHSLGRGFRAQYKFVEDFGIKAGERSKDKDKVCQFEFRSEKTSNGTFTSPNFPGLYPRNAECHYLFYGRRNERIYITFPYFDVEGVRPKCDEESQSDFVEFSNFNVKLIDRKMNRLCGAKAMTVKNNVNSDGNFFRVTFKSNVIYDATGFEAFYQFRRVDDPYEAPKRPSRASRSPKMTAIMRVLLGATLLTILLTIAH